MDSKTKRRHHAAMCRPGVQACDTRREAPLTRLDYCVANGAPLLLLAALMILIMPVQGYVQFGQTIQFPTSTSQLEAIQNFHIYVNNVTQLTSSDITKIDGSFYGYFASGFPYGGLTGNIWVTCKDSGFMTDLGSGWLSWSSDAAGYNLNGYTMTTYTPDHWHPKTYNGANDITCQNQSGTYGYVVFNQSAACAPYYDNRTGGFGFYGASQAQNYCWAGGTFRAYTGTEIPPAWDQTDFSCTPLFGPINSSVDCISETSPGPENFTWRLQRPNGTVSWDENDLDAITFTADEPGFYDVDLRVQLGTLDTWINKSDYISIQGTQGNLTPWSTAPNVSLQIDPVGTLAPWSIWNASTVRGDLETTFGNWSVPYLDMVDGMAAGLQVLFDNFTGLVNWAPLKILSMLQMVNGTLGSVIAAVSSSGNVLLQIMAHSLNALPWQLQGLLCYRITLDFIYLLLRGET